MLKALYLRIAFFTAALVLIPHLFPCIQESENAAPRIEITQVKILGFSREIRSDSDVREVIEHPEVLKISYKDNFLIIEFDVVGSKEPELNQYAYKITGRDEEWIHIGNKSFLILENLKAGKYDFRVKGANSEGIWSEESASLEIIVVPPFWKTPVFKGICVLFAAILFFVFFRRLRKIYKPAISVEVDIGQITTRYKLTNRESDMLELLLKGESIQSMAQELYISGSTVQKHIYSVYKKLKISNRMQLLNLARRFKTK